MTNNNEDSDHPDFCFPSSSIIPYHRQPHQQSQKPRKKRTKTIKINIDSQLINVPSSSTTCCSSSSTTTTTIGGLSSKPKYYGKKPDPLAPNITRPCTECGKKFWSWKALYGHMRCHPERQWRGINPPPNYRGPPTTSPVQQFTTTSTSTSVEAVMTAEDHDVAASLLLLANTTSSTPAAGETTALMETESGDYGGGGAGAGGCADGVIISTSQVQQEAGGGGNCRFECSSCKKVFGSHQALGGHRASHKNVKGCFAITTRSSDGCEVIDRQDHSGGDHHVKVENHMEDNSTSVGNNKKMVNMVLEGGHHQQQHHHHHQQHQCSICLRVFSSGQALGGHKRCHWEKVEEASSSINEGQGLLNVIAATNNSCGLLDLNLPAPIVDQESSSSYSSSALTLDLRLCL